jgi:hypothetical protein
MPLELRFLTDDERIRALCRLYWELDSSGHFIYPVAPIAEGLQVSASKVAKAVAEHCAAFVAGQVCPTCATPRLLTSRAEFKQRRPYAATVACAACQAAARVEAQRRAEEARGKAEELDRIRVRELQRTADRLRREAPDYASRPDLLPFADATYLVALFRAGGSDDMAYVVPHHAFSSTLSPSTRMDREILDHLYREETIAIHPGSRPESVEFSAGKFTSFYPLKVHWLLPLPEEAPSPSKCVENIETLIRARDEWPPWWQQEAEELHRRIALEECLEYLRVCLEEHGFDAEPTVKLTVAVRSLLARFSIGQAHNFIWRAAKDAAAFYVRERTSRAHAVNVVPFNLQRSAERAWIEGWAVKGFRRDRRVPESTVSHVLFTMALGLPDGGFSAVPPTPVADGPADESP